MARFIDAIPTAAASPYALFAYVVAAIGYFIAGRDLAQLREVRRAGLAGEALAREIARVIGEPLPPDLTPEIWMKYKAQRSRFLFAMITILLAAAIVVIAIVTSR